MKHIKKQLKKEAAAHSPDLYREVVSQAEHAGLFASERALAVQSDGSVALHRKKLGFGIGAALLALVVALAILLPMLLRPSGAGETTLPVRFSAQDFYGLGAVSAASFLNEDGAAGKENIVMFGTKAAMRTMPDAARERHVASFDRRFSAVHCFASNRPAMTTCEQNRDAEFAQFDTKMTVESTDVLGNTARYFVYYTETPVESDETEKEYVLCGAFAMHGIRYALDGARAYENDGDEQESEIYLKVWQVDTPAHYTVIEKETEVETGEREIRYVYKTFANGVQVEEFSVEFEYEAEDGKQTVDLTIEFDGETGKEKYEIVLADEKNARYEVSYVLPDADGTFDMTICASDAAHAYRRYTFADGATFTFPDPATPA